MWFLKKAILLKIASEQASGIKHAFYYVLSLPFAAAVSFYFIFLVLYEKARKLRNRDNI